MQIAPGFDSTAWSSLKLDDPNGPDWAKAIEIFRSRLEGRFVEPVDRLINLETKKPAVRRRYGFAVLAIDCLLIETLGAFVAGLADTRGRSERVFSDFLTRPEFSGQFSSPHARRQFYTEFRCGILHQAEVGGRSRVWSVGPAVSLDHGRITVNRSKFHDLVKRAFTGYVAELRDPTKVELRRNFRHKMDFISSR